MTIFNHFSFYLVQGISAFTARCMNRQVIAVEARLGRDGEDF